MRSPPSAAVSNSRNRVVYGRKQSAHKISAERVAATAAFVHIGGFMSHWKSFGLAIFAAVGLLGETVGPAHAQCTPIPNFNCATEWSGGSVINLGGASTLSQAFAINNAGQVVGQSGNDAVIWSGGSIINLGRGLPYAINNAGQVVGLSPGGATEWSGGSVINLGLLAGSTFGQPLAINDAGQVAGLSAGGGGGETATEWSGGSVINLGGLPGSEFSVAYGINDAGEVVGESYQPDGPHAVEWSGGSVIDLGFGIVFAINNVGQMVGTSVLGATEWSGGSAIALVGGGVPFAINDAGQAAGFNGLDAVEWSGGSVINLEPLPGSTQSQAYGINDAGQVVGLSIGVIPEPSTWAMMLLGFAGLGVLGYRQARRSRIQPL
jgi:probable HAF family extracellular repeat protein